METTRKQPMQQIKTHYGALINSKLFEAGQHVEHNGHECIVIEPNATGYEIGHVTLQGRNGIRYVAWANYCDCQPIHVSLYDEAA